MHVDISHWGIGIKIPSRYIERLAQGIVGNVRLIDHALQDSCYFILPPETCQAWLDIIF